MDTLRFELQYEWECFTVEGQALTFAQLGKKKLFPNECSHWGAAVYKWEGAITRGFHVGKVGILIGETESIARRIQEYATATSARGILYTHRAFLAGGDMRLFILKVHDASVGSTKPKSIFGSWPISDAKERRLLLKELLLSQYAVEKQPHIVLANWGR